MKSENFQNRFKASPGAFTALACLGIFGFLAGIVFEVALAGPHDKAVHGVFFFVLAVLLHLVLGGRVGLVVVIATGLGAISELVQALTAHHQASLYDFFADLAGIWFYVVSGAIVKIAREARMAPAKTRLNTW